APTVEARRGVGRAERMAESPYLREAKVLDLGASHLDEVRVDVERIDRGDQGLVVQVFRDVPEGAADLEHGEPRGPTRPEVGEEALEEVAPARLLEGKVRRRALD